MDSQYDNGGPRERHVPNSDLFPPTRAQLDGFPVQVPHGFDNIAGILFGRDYQTECKSRRWDNVHERATKGTVTKMCVELMVSYPFAPEWKRRLGVKE